MSLTAVGTGEKWTVNIQMNIQIGLTEENVHEIENMCSFNAFLCESN